jgi:dTMP kinase
MFISLEGIEGAGKSTLANSLLNYFKSQNQAVILTREPGGTPLAEEIRHTILHSNPSEKLSKNAELLLMFASRIQHIEQLIKPALEKNKIVISDRYIDASYAYQGGGRGIEFENISILENIFIKNNLPDITLLLDLPLDKMKERLKKAPLDKIEKENLEFFYNVRSAYLKRAKNNPERIKIIDASQSTNIVLEQSLAFIKGKAS